MITDVKWILEETDSHVAEDMAWPCPQICFITNLSSSWGGGLSYGRCPHSTLLARSGSHFLSVESQEINEKAHTKRQSPGAVHTCTNVSAAFNLYSHKATSGQSQVLSLLMTSSNLCHLPKVLSLNTTAKLSFSPHDGDWGTAVWFGGKPMF